MLRALPTTPPEKFVVAASGQRVVGWRMPETFVVELPAAGEGHGGHVAGPAGAFVLCENPVMGGWFGLPERDASGRDSAVPASLVDAAKAKE